MYTGPGLPVRLHETNAHNASTRLEFPMASLHSTSAPPTLAVIIVVDSSITLVSEWSHICRDYFPHLLRRLAGDSPSSLDVGLLLLSHFCVHSQNFHPLSTFA